MGILGMPSFRYVNNNEEKHNDIIIPQERESEEYFYKISIDRAVRKSSRAMLDEQIKSNKNEYLRFDLKVNCEDDLHNSDILIRRLEDLIDILKNNKDKSE